MIESQCSDCDLGLVCYKQVMAEEPFANRHIKRSQEVGERFDAYFLTLTFTLVAAAIQTAKWSDTNPLSNYAEVAGWLFLAASGLVALYRAEQAPHFYVAAAHHATLEDYLDSLRKRGAPPEHISEFGRLTLEAAVKLETINARTMEIYKWQRGLFVVGLLVSIGRRGSEGLFH
jgi:hypothetical protein